MENSKAVEVLLLERHIKDIKDYAEYPNKRLINSLEKALLALERLDRLEKWLDDRNNLELSKNHKASCYMEELESSTIIDFIKEIKKEVLEK